MKVLKFGGTSVGSVDNIRKVVEILKTYKKRYVVVFSAMSGVTNQLIELGTKAALTDDSYKSLLKEIEQKHSNTVKALIDIKSQSKVIAQVKVHFNELEDLLHGIYLLKELSPRTLDLLQSFGERLSSYIVAEYMKQSGIKTVHLDAREVVKTDGDFGSAKVNVKLTHKNIQVFVEQAKGNIVTTGFIGSTDKNETTTLGRGGSDYTASIFGAALDAEDIEIWTDVDGMMTADPRKVKSAFTLPSISYVEAMEMSHFGAKVIYPPTLAPAFAKKIPIWIKNTFNPTFEGTVISEKSKETDFMIKGITSIENITLVTLQGSGMVGVAGVSARLFTALARYKINVILITQASSEHSICLVVDGKEAQKAKTAIDEEFAVEVASKKIEPAILRNNLAVLAIIGDNMRKTPGISAKLFNSMGKNNVNVVAIAQGSSELNLSVVIEKNDLSKALNAIHQSFFLSDTKTVNLFVVGLGLIGATLLKQIQKQQSYLQKELHLKINVIGLANTKKMLIADNGIALSSYANKIEEQGVKSNLSTFVEKMKALNLPNTVFVDNTSSKEVVAFYDELLQNRISIVTPNKLANSGPFKNYTKLHQTAFSSGVKFMYETNVGAGLPVINTLKDLKYSGDRILTIEGILSGTLSYIFNTFKGDKKFSDVVKEAKEKGFTEPDPRDDLNGMDVARKILILAREAGAELEFDDVQVENILPESCRKAKTVDAFFVELEKNNQVFAKLRDDADKKGKVLRFIAKFDNGKASVGLASVDSNHAFYSLSGSDNMIAFTTERYKERPLVIKGPGAGAEVTAAGVFAEIISISNYLKG
ncbi:MAG: thrA [Chitinophagaceae bacterium]|nr:thrA [Chitinophagaceae bacterium]